MSRESKPGKSRQHSRTAHKRIAAINARHGILCKPAEIPPALRDGNAVEPPPDRAERQAQWEQALGLKPGELDEERVRLRLRAAMDIMLRNLTDSQAGGTK